MENLKLELLKVIEFDDDEFYKKVEKYRIANYEVKVVYSKVLENEDEKNKICNISIMKDFGKSLIPDIYCNIDYDDNYESKKITFEIQTNGWGTQDIKGIQKVIKGYENAIEIVKILEESFS